MIIVKSKSITNVPLSIGKLGLWLDANDPNGNGSQLANNAAVSTWTDKSVLKLNATQGTGANQPISKTNSLNGMPGISFNGSTDFLQTPFNSQFNFGTAGISIIAVASTGVTAGVSRIIATAAGSNGYAFGRSGTGYRFTAYTVHDYDVTSTQWVLNTPMITACTFDNTANVNFYTASTNIGTVTFTGSIVNTSAGMNIGIGNGGFEFWLGTIYEIIVYFKVLSATELLTVERYCANKWGLLSA